MDNQYSFQRIKTFHSFKNDYFMLNGLLCTVHCLLWQLFLPHQVPRPLGPMLCCSLSSSHKLHILQPVCPVSPPAHSTSAQMAPAHIPLHLTTQQVLSGPDDHHAWERRQSPRSLLLSSLQVCWATEPDRVHLLPALHHPTVWDQLLHRL